MQTFVFISKKKETVFLVDYLIQPFEQSVSQALRALGGDISALIAGPYSFSILD